MIDQPEGDTPDVESILEQDGRKLLAAKILPSEGGLSDEERAEVREAVKTYCTKHRITMASLARQVGGITRSLVAKVLNDSYLSSPDEFLRAFNNWMEVDARRREGLQDGGFIQTVVAKRIMGCASHASQMLTMVIAHGPTGIGKSMVAKVVAERFPGSVYIRLSTGTTGYYALRKVLGCRLRIDRRGNTAAGRSLDERIFDEIRGSGRLIVIDEGHRISDAALEFLRDVHDETGVPILFLCTKDLVDRIRRDSDGDHGQMYSRFGYVCDLVHGYDKVPGGSHPLFSVADIRNLFAIGQVRLLPDATAFLQDLASMLGHGSLRRCKWVMRWAVAIERAYRGLGPRDVVEVSAALLRKAELEPMRDDAMLADIESRLIPVAKTA